MVGFEKFKVCQKAIRKVNYLKLVSTLSHAFQFENERVNNCPFNALYHYLISSDKMSLDEESELSDDESPPMPDDDQVEPSPPAIIVNNLNNNNMPLKKRENTSNSDSNWDVC